MFLRAVISGSRHRDAVPIPKNCATDASGLAASACSGAQVHGRMGARARSRKKSATMASV